MRASELSVYNLRLASIAQALASNNLSAEDISDVTKEKRVLSMRADTIGEVKLLAEAHRRRMEMAQKLDAKAIPVELQIRLTVRKDEKDKINDVTKVNLLKLMEIEDVLKPEALILVDEDRLDTLTLKDIARDLAARSPDAKQIAIVERLDERRKDEDIPDNTLFVEYEDEFVTSYHYDAVLELMARPDSPTLSDRFRLWFRIKPITKIDYKELQKEMERYKQVLMAA